MQPHRATRISKLNSWLGLWNVCIIALELIIYFVQLKDMLLVQLDEKNISFVKIEDVLMLILYQK